MHQGIAYVYARGRSRCPWSVWLRSVRRLVAGVGRAVNLLRIIAAEIDSLTNHAKLINKSIVLRSAPLLLVGGREL